MHHFNNQQFRYGSARIASEDSIHLAGAFTFGPETRFGGMAYGKCFGHSGMAGELIVGGARSGKFATLLAYQLCLGGSLHNRIILDVKAEAFFVMNLLAAEGRYNYIWNPCRINAPSHRVNPLDYMTLDSPSLIDDVIAFCEMAIPLTGAPQSKFFELRGRWFLQNLCLVLVEMDEVLRFDRLYWAITRFVAGDEAWVDELAFPMSRSRFDDVRACEEEIHGLRSRDGGGFDGICGEISKSFICLSSPLLRESVSPPYDFSFKQLCEADQLYTINLCPKGEYVRQWSLVIKSMFLAAKTYRAAHPSAPRQHWVIDEAAQLGAAQFLVDAYVIGAGSWGVTPMTIWQSTYQMKALGPDAENILISSAGYQAYFGVRDMPSATTLSKRIGSETLEYDDTVQQAKSHEGYNDALLELLGGGDILTAGLKASHHQHVSGLSSKQRRDVRTPDEILNMPSDKMFVFMDDIDGAIYADRRPYYRIPWMAGRYLGSLYYPPQDRVQIMTDRGPQQRRIITEPVPPALSHFPQYQQCGEWSYVEGFKPCLS